MLKTIAIAALTALVLVIACAEDEHMTLPNSAPETYVALADPIQNVTLYRQTITWWGDDADGEIAEYQYRWFTDPVQQSCRFDTLWHSTETTSEVFNLPVDEDIRSHRFEVRAVDDDGAWDRSPATLTVPVTNSPPVVSIADVQSLPDTTLPALLVRVGATDPDGDNTVALIRAWLDGNDLNPVILQPGETEVSFGPEAFENIYGWRTLNVIASDSGCARSEVVTHTWYVMPPEGDVLLVDDISDAAGVGEALADSFYRKALQLCDVAYSVLDLEEYGGVTYAHNFPELFGHFDLVIWYNGHYSGEASATLSDVEEYMTTHVEAGGKLLLQSLIAVGSGGALHDSVALEIFGVDSLYLRGQPPNQTTNFDCKKWHLQGNAAIGLDSLKVESTVLGVECMKPKATATGLYWTPEGAVSDVRYHLAVLNSYGSGKAALLTFPISRSRAYANARAEFCKIVDLLLY